MSFSIDVLETIGLSPGESKVYLSLLELGPSTVTPLAKHSKVTASKIYPITDRLIEKGLASFIVKENRKYFSATSPSRIKDFLTAKQSELEKQRKLVDEILPQLQAKSPAHAGISAEVLIGWKGLEAAYEDIFATLKRGDIDYVIGASAGTAYKRTKRFYERVMARGHATGVKFKVISQERIRSHFEDYQGPKKHIQRRYIKLAAHAETNVFFDTVLIIIHGELPTIVKIRSKEVADSYRAFFNELWAVAKP